MDLFEIALDYFTDFKKFEQLAAEIVVQEGHGNITVIGGIDDEGIDAQQVKYFTDENKTTIFQFTIQENIGSKINDTMQKSATSWATISGRVISSILMLIRRPTSS